MDHPLRQTPISLLCPSLNPFFLACSLAILWQSSLYGVVRERESSLADFKLHAARFRVCNGLATPVGVLGRVSGQPILGVGIVCADMDQQPFLIEVNFCDFPVLCQPWCNASSLLRPCYAIGAFFGYFLQLLTCKKIKKQPKRSLTVLTRP